YQVNMAQGQGPAYSYIEDLRKMARSKCKRSQARSTKVAFAQFRPSHFSRPNSYQVNMAQGQGPTYSYIEDLRKMARSKCKRTQTPNTKVAFAQFRPSHFSRQKTYQVNMAQGQGPTYSYVEDLRKMARSKCK